MIVSRISVHMADTEWSSHEDYRIMERLATEQLIIHQDKITPESTVFVTVYEHAGWWLTYAPALDTGALVIVGSANDSGQPSEAAKRIGERFQKAKSEYLDSIRR